MQHTLHSILTLLRLLHGYVLVLLRRLRARYLRSDLHRGLTDGSFGGELSSGAIMLAWGVAILHTPILRPANHVTRLLAAYHPIFAAVMVLVGGLHLVLALLFRTHLRAVGLRKAISVVSLLFWLEVVSSFLIIGSRAAGYALIMTCVLLVYAIGRREY